MNNRKNPLDRAMELGNAYCDNKENAINNLKNALTTESVNEIWKAITKKRENYEDLEECRLPIERLITEMLSDDFYLSKLPDESLEQIGKTSRWCIPVMYALQKKHREGNFPVEHIVALGKYDIAIAKMLLEELQGKTGYFQVSAKWVRLHPSLEAREAKRWQRYFDVYSLTNDQEREFVEKEIKSLGRTFPKFRALHLGRRVNRDPGPVRSNYTEANEYFGYICIGATVAVVAIYFAPAVIPLIQSAIVPASVPVAVAVGENIARRAMRL